MATLSDLSLANPLNDQTPPETGGNPLTDQAQGPAPGDYLSNFDHNTVMQDPNFLSDARKYYELRDGLPIWSDDDLRQKFMSDRTFKNVNSLGIVSDWVGAAGQSSDMNALEGKLQTVYQRLPSFWQEGGRGAAGLGENLAAMAVDPINLIPLGEIAKVAQGVGIAAKAAEAGGSALAAGLKQGGAAALREGALMGTIGAGYDALSQERDITLGLQPSFNWAQIAQSAATMAALGGAPAAIGGTVRGALAGADVLAKVRAWPTERGVEVAKLEHFKQSAEAAAGANNGDVAQAMTAKANAQQAIIERMDQQYRNRGGTDDQLGIAKETPEAPPDMGAADVDPSMAANRQRLLDMQKMYTDELQNPHVDPNSPENLDFQKKLENIDWSLNYDEYAAKIGATIDQIMANPKAKPKDIEQVNSLRAYLTQRGAVRDALLQGAPKTATEVDQAIDAHGLGVGPNRGFGVDVYGQTATPAREGVPYPMPAREEGPAVAGAGVQMPAPAGAPAPAPAPAPAAPGEVGAPAPVAAPVAAPAAPAGGGGAGGEGAAAGEVPEPPEIAAATADTSGASAAEVAVETPAEKRERLKAAKPQKVETMPLTEAWQEVPEGAVLPAGAQVQMNMETGKNLARLAPHPISEAPTAAVSEEATRIDHELNLLLDQVHDTKGYKYAGKTEAGKLSMEAALGQAGYDEEAIGEITRQIREEVKGVPAGERANIQREMLSEAVVLKQIERVEGALEAAGVDPSTDILKAVINEGVTDQRVAATAMRILDGRSRLKIGADEAPQGSTAEDFMRQLEAMAKGGDETLHEGGGLSREQRKMFTGIARKETDARLAKLDIPMEAKGRFYSESMHFNELFLSSSYLPGSHEARLATYRNFLDELERRYKEQQTARVVPSTGAAESRFGNPDEIYKKNPLRPGQRAGIPGILKKANQAGFIGRGLGKADIGTVGEARARAQLEKWRDVKAITLRERYMTADGKELKPGEVAYYNPLTDKAYADPLLAGRRRPDEPGAQPTGGQTVIPAVPSAREADIAKAAGIDPVAYATRLRDLDPRSVTAEGSIETESGTIGHGVRYIRTKDGAAYKDAAELRTSVAESMKAEPAPTAPAPAAPPVATAQPPAMAISPEVRRIAEAAGVDPAVLQAALAKEGMLKEGPVPTPPDPAAADVTSGYGGVPENWVPPPGRKLSIRNLQTGSVRTLNPAQRTVDEMLAGKPRDGWEIGSNKADISSGQQGAAREDFIRAGEEPPTLTQAADVPEVPKVTDPGDMLNTDQARTTPLAEPLTVRNEQGQVITVTNALDAAEVLRSLHTGFWPQTQAAMKDLIDQIEVLTKAAPKVKQPSVTRQAARQSLTTVFEKMAPEQLGLALDALRRLPGVDAPDVVEMSPRIIGGTARGVATGYGTRQVTDLEGNLLEGGAIGLADPNTSNYDYPLISILHHEIGHWGYDNILSDEERLSYMKWVHDTFYTGGKLDRDLIDAAAPTRGASRTPQEMFASQFQRWVASNGKSMPVPTSLMQKFANYLVHFLDRWFGGSTDIDKSLEPLFAKIMPDPVADSWLKTLGSEGATAEGKALVDGIRSLDKARYGLEVGLTSSNPTVIEAGIRGAMNAIDRSAETLGRERTDALSTRLANIIKNSESVTRTYDPELERVRVGFAERGLDAGESWNALPDGERRVLQANFEDGNLASIGSDVELDNGDWTVTSFDGGDSKNPTFTVSRLVENGTDTAQYTRNELSRMGAGHVVPQDQYDMTRLVLTDNPDPVLTTVKAANEAHQVLTEAFADHQEAFNRIEGGGSALRVDNPTTLPAEPVGSTATYIVGNQIRINEAIKLLESASSTSDVMGVEHMIEAMDEIARVTGRTGINRKTGSVSTAFGGVHFKSWMRLSGAIKQRGRDIVDEAYRMFTDFNSQTEAEFERAAQLKGAQTTSEAKAGEKGYAKNVTVTMGSMTDTQRAQYDDLIRRALDFVPDLHTELDRVRRWAEATTRKNIEKGTYVVGRKVPNDVKKTLRIKSVAKAASTKRPRAQDEIKGLGASPDLPSFKGMSDVQLADSIIQHGARSKTGLQLGAELLQRDKTAPFLPHVKAEDVPNDIMQADTALLGVKLKTAIESGDKKTADQVRWEALRRARKNAIRRGVIDTADADVVASINREMDQTMGVPDHVGVPEGSPAIVKDMLSRFTHRKADVQTSLRTAMYRLLNLGGITDVASRDGITVGRLYRLAGRELPDHVSPSATVFDIREPVFSEVRSAMRRLVGNFAEGKGDAGENISNMVEMVLRSGLVNDHEYGAIQRAYDLTGDKIKSSLVGSGITPMARRPDAWFADHMAEYLMGNRGTAEMFKPDVNASAPGFNDAVKEAKAVVERVKDATAYVVNGLMHDNMRREFPSLTDYGDVFEQPRSDKLQTNPAPAGMEEQGVLNQHAMDNDAPRINAIFLNAMINADHTLHLDDMPRASVLVADAAEKGGAGPRTNKLVAAGLDGLKRTAAYPEAFRWNFGHIYKRGSDLMREYGMNWWGDQLNPRDGAGLYHKITVKAADYLMPLYSLSHQMPDAVGKAGNWMRHNKFWGEVAQPKSHANVVEALRGMKSYSSLTGAEKGLHDAYRAAFGKVLKELDDAGVQIGNVGHFYFPQVVDEEAVRRNMSGAIDAYATYLHDESRGPMSVLPSHLTMNEAREKAADIVNGMVENGGVYMPPKAERRASKADNIDHQRMFRLHETLKDPKTGKVMTGPDGAPMMRFERAYQMMKPFMHNHLEAVSSKYFDAAARRIVTTEALGTNSHAYFDYMHVMQGGEERAQERAGHLLSTKKVIRQNFMGQADDGGFEEATRNIDAYTPMSEREADLAISAALDQMGDGKTEADIQKGVGELVSRMGDKGQTGVRRADAVMHALADTRNRGGRALGHDEYGRADSAYRVAMQKPIGSQSNIARKTSRVLRNFNSITMLGWTTVTSFADLMYPLLRSGNLGALGRAWTNFATDPVYRAAMRNTGSAIEQLVHDRLGLIHGGEGTRLTRSFFNLNMLTHWDSFVREIGSSVAWESFKAEQARAIRAGPETRAWRMAESRLKRYGLDHYLTNGRSLNDPRLLNIDGGDETVRQGLVKFVNECVFSHTPDDIPLWAQTPLGKLAFQLKSFQVQMSRMTFGHDGVVQRAAKGDVMPLIYMLTMGTGWAAGVNVLKDVVQGRGGPDNNSHALRERRLSDIAKKFGWNANIHGPADVFLGNYAEGFMMLGGFGFLTDLLYQAGQQADNGAWGYQRFLGSVLGPTADLAHVGWEAGVVAPMDAMGASTPSKIHSDNRTLVGDVARRLPVFGGVRSITDYLTDQIAGPKAGGEAGSGPYGQGDYAAGG